MLCSWRRLSRMVENQVVWNRGKVNRGPDAVKVRGRHQGSTNPKAPVSGLTENSSSFLTRADEKNTSKKVPISKNVRKDGAECLENDVFCLFPSQ